MLENINALPKEMIMWKLMAESTEIPEDLKIVAKDKLRQFELEETYKVKTAKKKEIDYGKEKRLGFTPKLSSQIENIPDDMLLSPTDVSQYLMVSERQVRRYCANAELTAIRSGRNYGITGADLKEFLRKRAPRPKAIRDVLLN